MREYARIAIGVAIGAALVALAFAAMAQQPIGHPPEQGLSPGGGERVQGSCTSP